MSFMRLAQTSSLTPIEPSNTKSVAALSAILPTYTNDQISDFLAYNWLGGASFNIGASRTITVNITALNTDGKYLATAALEAWTMATGINFTQISGAAGITFDDVLYGASAGPDSITGSTINSASVDINTSWIASDGSNIDSYSFQTYMHEIGHALGLDHAGNYNGNGTYATNGSGDNHYLNDSWQATVMSYFDQSEAGTGTYRTLLTPMIADILAIQTLYGVDGSLRTGDTIYGVSSTAGGYYDTNLDAGAAFTIIDDGGVDTIDFSNVTAAQTVDLNQEAISDVGGLIGNMIIMRDTVIENFKSGSGSDSITGNSADNTLYGGGGHDNMWGQSGSDTIYGEGGNDSLNGDNGNDIIWGGTGGDTISGGNGYDTIWGESGADTLSGNGGNDTIDGGGGIDTIFGGGGDDTISGSHGDDLTYGGSGNDTIYGQGGNDIIDGEKGLDILRGGAGHDLIHGNAYSDNIEGGSGNDDIYGDTGDDTIQGGAGTDTLHGGAGTDFITGGNAADVFYFKAGWGIDRINDFEDNIDSFALHTVLWGGGYMSNAQILSNYATVVADSSAAGSHVELNFGGGDVIKVFGITTTAALLDDMFIY